MGHEIIFVAQQFAAIQCYQQLARFHIHPFLWSLEQRVVKFMFLEGRVVWLEK
jgi:hypothetical protein